MTARVWNNSERTMSAYKSILSETDRNRTELALIGAVRDVDPRAVSLREVEQMGVDTEKPVSIPVGLSKDKSFLIYEPAAQIASKLKAMGFAKTWQKDTPAASNWVDASKLLNDDASLLAPPS